MKEWLRSKEKAVYRVINAGILAGMALLGGQGFLGTGELGRAHLTAALAVLAVSAALNFMAVRGRALILAALSVFLLTGAAVAGIEDSIRFLGSFFLWLSGSGEVAEVWNLWYGVAQAGLLAGMCYLVQILFEKIPALKTTAGILALLAMGVCLFAEQELNHYGVAFLMVFCVIAWVEWIQGRWKKERSLRGGREAHTLWIMPFLALYLVLLVAMPVPEKPYDWLWAKNIYRQLQESFLTYTQNIKWGGREGFGMAFSGFSDSGELGGDLLEDAERIMQIRVNKDAFRNLSTDFDGSKNILGSLYLTGNVYDTFDGRGWQKDWQGHPGEVFLDTSETLYAVRNYNGKYQKDYLREISLEIRYEDFNTGYVFAPLKVWGMEGEELPDYTNAGGVLLWTGRQGYGTEYGLRYFRMNVGQQEFDRFLETAGNHAGNGVIRESEAPFGSGGEGQESEAIRENSADTRVGREKHGVNEEIWAEVQRECERRNGEIVTWDDILLYRKEIYENFLGDVMLSSEVSRYLDEITEKAETDVEKLRAIERALRSFSYTLTPGALPDWVEEAGDFLDYFLLESRQGYCTYFATAFVLLSRAEGIPARYVQGYCVPVPESGEASVDSSMAHAWPEVYLKGVGWIPFEPTPGYGDKLYSVWGLEQPEPGNMASGQEDFLFSGNGPDGETETAGDILKTENGLESNEVEAEEEKASYYLWKLLGMGIPLLLIVCTMVLAAEYAIRRYRYKKMDFCERLRTVVFRNLEILSRLGVKKKEGETLQELRERAEFLPELAGEGAEEVLSEVERAEVLRFIEDYEQVVYGGKEAREDMLERAAQAGEMLLRLLKKEKKWAYFYCRMELFLEGIVKRRAMR